MFRVLLLTLAVVVSQPARAQERQWLLDAAGEEVFLAFGVPNTDDVGISFWCKSGQQGISLFSPFQGREKRPKLTLLVGAESFPLDAKVNNNEGTKTVEARLRPEVKILNALNDAERFEVDLGKHKAVYPLADADFQGLIKLCATRLLPAEN